MADFFPAALLPSQDPELLALIAIFLLVSGIVKGFLGIGLPAAGMALLTLIMPPTEAIALLWVPIIVSNAWQFSRAPGRAQHHHGLPLVCRCHFLQHTGDIDVHRGVSDRASDSGHRVRDDDFLPPISCSDWRCRSRRAGHGRSGWALPPVFWAG
jgi:hypothetical protein